MFEAPEDGASSQRTRSDQAPDLQQMSAVSQSAQDRSSQVKTVERPQIQDCRPFSLNQSAAEGTPLAARPLVTYRLRRDKWVVDSHDQDWYRNSLLVAVGFLDLTNGLDFPANVWNSDVPTFAYVLMGVFGAIALLWTSFAFWDLSRSLKNIRFLKEERAGLRARQDELSRRPVHRLERQRLIKAWLDIEYRELGWEYIDRAVMDGLIGFSGILVGTGTILAIGGADDRIFLASNLLSGYIGNSFIAAYGICNAGWSVFMWLRARRHLRAIADSRKAVNPAVRRRMRWHAFQHQVYATLNAVSMLVGSAGSLVSSKLWYGYIILAPCVIGSIFCNVFWRTKLGYNRLSFDRWVGKGGMDIAERLEKLREMRVLLISRHSLRLEDTIASEKTPTKEDVVKFLQNHCLLGEFGAHLLQISNPREARKKDIVTMTLSMRDVLTHEYEDIVDAATSALLEAGQRSFREQERFLLELYGCYLVAIDEGKDTAPEEDLDEEKQDESSSSQDGALSRNG